MGEKVFRITELTLEELKGPIEDVLGFDVTGEKVSGILRLLEGREGIPNCWHYIPESLLEERF